LDFTEFKLKLGGLKNELQSEAVINVKLERPQDLEISNEESRIEYPEREC
jgi:hypothetical protein